MSSQEISELDHEDYLDVLSQRVHALSKLASFTFKCDDPEVKEICLDVMRRVANSIRTPPVGEVVVLKSPISEDP